MSRLNRVPFAGNRPKEQINLAVCNGEAILKPTMGDNEEKQVQMIEKMMEVVAKDTTVNIISRMIRFNTAVHQCVKGKAESIKEYVKRFKIPALGYLNMVSAGEDSS